MRYLIILLFFFLSCNNFDNTTPEELKGSKYRIECLKCQEIKKIDCKDCGIGRNLFSGLIVKADKDIPLYHPIKIHSKGNLITLEDAFGNSFSSSISDIAGFSSISRFFNYVKNCTCVKSDQRVLDTAYAVKDTINFNYSNGDFSYLLTEGELVRMSSNPINDYGATEDAFVLKYHRDLFPDLYGQPGPYAVDFSINIPGFSTELNSGATGLAAFSANFNTTASDDFAASFGFKTKATNQGAFTYGFLNESSGVGAFSGGTGSRATERNTFAVGEGNLASNVGAVSLGANNESSGQTSFTSGDGNVGSGINAVALGLRNFSGNDNTFSSGQFNESLGRVSTTIGDHLIANSYAEMAVGHYNESPTAFNQVDPDIRDQVFSIGIGDETDGRKNAVTVFKSGVINLLPANLNIASGSSLGDHVVDNTGTLNKYTTDGWRPYLSSSKEGLILPKGTTLERGSSIEPRIRFNTDTNQVEIFDGTIWKNL